MTKKASPKPTDLLAPYVTGDSGGVHAKIQRREGEIAVSVDGDAPILAESTLAIDCACATIHEGYAELRLGQRHRLVPKLTRLLVVRYARDMFARRIHDNEKFRLGLETWLRELGPKERGEPGYFAKALLNASDSEPTTAILDPEAEWMVWSGHRGAIVFISTTSWERYKATTGKSDTLWLFGSIEVTMPARVLADLLLSWKQVAEELDGVNPERGET